MSAILSGTRLSRRVGTATLLSNVSVSVEPGELLAIVGPNGAGKSTLLHLLAGDVRPDEGEVRWLGKPLCAWSLADLARVRAVVPQHAPVEIPFTVIEVVLLGRGPHLRGAESREDVAIARGSLERVRLARLADRFYPSLSGGERQRVHLARALAQLGPPTPPDRRALLLDEPTASLDLKHQHETLRAARELADEGAAVIAVLHDLGLAAEYADTMALLDEGALRAHGSPDEVLDEALFAEVYDVPLRILPAPWDASRRLVLVERPSSAARTAKGAPSRIV